MALKNLLLILALMMITCLTANIATATSRKNMKPPGYNLAARLDEASSGGLMECWSALMELKSCSNEILIFFLNGQTEIGPGCCRAIDIITSHCWPAMLTSLGFTAEEGNILRGYCVAAASSSSAPSPGGPEVIYQPY